MTPTMQGACRWKGESNGTKLKNANKAKVHRYEHVKMSMPIARPRKRSIKHGELAG